VVMKETNIGNIYNLEGNTEIREAKIVSKQVSTSTCLRHQ
jgi:hypothetical protein